MDMACELNDMELDAVSGGTCQPKAPHFNFHDVTINQGNSVAITGNVSGGSVSGGSNTSTFNFS